MGQAGWRVLKRVGWPELLVVGALVTIGNSACGSESPFCLGGLFCEGESEGLPLYTVQLYGPDPTEFPERDPFAGCDEGADDCTCDFVKVCWASPGSTSLQDCVTQPPTGREVSFQIPEGETVVVVAECYEGLVDPATNETVLDGPRASGQSCPLLSEAGPPDWLVSIYMLPIASYGPTQNPVTGHASSAQSERWGAVAENLPDGSILLAGGALAVAGCADWGDPSCVGPVFDHGEIYNPGSREVQSPVTGVFELLGTEPGQEMSEGRAFSASVALPDGRVAIFGGLNGSNLPTDTVEIFSPSLRTFSAGPPMEYTRAYHTASLIWREDDGFVLLAGGLGSGDATWEVWTPGYGTTASGALNESRWRHTATLVDKTVDEKAREVVVIAGGEGQTRAGLTVLDTLELFDITIQAIQSEQPLLCSNGGAGSPPALRRTMHAAVLVPKRHFIYIAGGFSDPEHLTPERDICVWHTTQEKWEGEAGKFMWKTGVGAPRAFEVPGNAVGLVCGLTQSGGLVEVGGIMRPNDSLQPVPGMLVPRWDCGAIMGADGKVLIYGGLGGTPDQPVSLQATEVFSP